MIVYINSDAPQYHKPDSNILPNGRLALRQTWLSNWSHHNHQGQETEPGEAHKKNEVEGNPQKEGEPELFQA